MSSQARQQLERLLAELVAIPSVTGEEQALACRVEARLADRGWATARQPLPGQPDRFNIVADSGGGGPAWLLAGHLDTVPPAHGWESDPFRLEVCGARLSGLGAWDMKGGLAALLALADRRRPGQPRLKLAFLADEEGESAGSQALVQSGFLADVAAALFPEAGPGADHEQLALTLGRAGRVLLEVTLRCSAAHAAEQSRPSALLAAARAALAASEAPVAHHPLLGPGRCVPRELHSSSRGALSVPEEGWLRIDRLLVPPERAEHAAAQLAAYLQGQSLQAEVQVRTVPRSSPYLEPFLLEPTHPLVCAVQARLARTGLATVPVHAASVADENRLAMAGIPTLSLSPAGGAAHGPGEWVDRNSLARLADALEAVVAEQPP